MNPVAITLDTLILAESLIGWNLTGGAGAATCNLRMKAASGAANSGALIATISVAANTTDTVMFGHRMIAAPGGIYVEDIAGTMAGVLFVA